MNQLFLRKIQTDGYDLVLKGYDMELVEINARQKSLFVKIPIDFSFIKSAGLFSIEGEGCIRVFVEIKCDISENFKLTTESILQEHEWIKEPVLIVGKLTIPIETLSNCIIRYMNEDMLNNLDLKISNDLDLYGLLVNKLNSIGVNYPISKKPELFFNSQLLQIQMDVLREDASDIHLHMWLEIMSKISDLAVHFEQNQNPKFYWYNGEYEKSVQSVDIELSYQGLAKVLMTELNGKELGGKTFEIESINIRNTSFLEIKINLVEPIKGIITINGNPILDKTNQKLYITNLGIDIDAQNFIYKLSSPIMEKIIRNKIEALMPLDPLPLFTGFIDKIPSFNIFDNMVLLKPQVLSIKIEQLQFNVQSISSTLLLEGAIIDVVI
ncbi:MAG: DUF4403 family protein [Saprospiraceae bacterium]|nr:DUF4403 family protein [Saprospiraceae bacterium]